jgi:type IV pilus assembly protein PilN
MFNLDINFLNDRPDLKPSKSRAASSPRSQAAAPGDKRPMYIGAAAFVFFPVLAGALWGILTMRMGDLEQQQAQLDSQLGNLETEKKKLAEVTKEITQATEEMQALATVFNQIKPWSAMSQDLRDRLPANIQLRSITQSLDKDTASQASTGKKSSPFGKIVLEGLAPTFNDVNDFLLVLQRSKFLKPEETQIVTADLGEEGTIRFPSGLSKNNGAEVKLDGLPKLPRKVKFTIQTAINDVPASELLRELDRKGAVGLVARIDQLRNQGVVTPANGEAPKPAEQPKGGKP